MNSVPDAIQKIEWIGPDKRTALLHATGDIDLHRSAGFQQALLDVAELRPKRIVLDLSGVGYMDSSGVASLVKLLARARRDEVDLRLSGLTSRVRSVFEITRLDTVFEIYTDLEEALQS